jgi:hypothetical protein
MKSKLISNNVFFTSIFLWIVKNNWWTDRLEFDYDLIWGYFVECFVYQIDAMDL